jgi:hypothetical protein
MRSSACLAAAWTLAACSNAPLATTLTAPSPAPAPDVFQCARNGLKAIGFEQASYDVAENRLTARRYDYEARRPDVQFRRLVDRLEVEADPGAGGDAMTTLKVTAHTFGEYTTQRGPTEVEERPSEAARAAATTLVERCRTPSDTTRVPE